MELPLTDREQTEFRWEGQTRDINLGIINIETILKAKLLDANTNGTQQR